MLGKTRLLKPFVYTMSDSCSAGSTLSAGSTDEGGGGVSRFMVNHGQSTSGWLPPQTLHEWLGALSPSSLELDEDADELGDSSPGLARSNTGYAGGRMRKPGTGGAEDEAGISAK